MSWRVGDDIVVDAPSSLLPNGFIAPWFGKVIMEAAEACGITADKISAERQKLYAQDLAEHAPEKVITAFRQARKTGSGFFPSISEINRAIQGAADDSAVLAWAGLERAAVEAGSWASMQIDDPCAAVALRRVFGGWPAFCAQEQGPDMHVKRQAFIAAYRAARAVMPAGAQGQRFAGLCEASGDYERTPASWLGHLLASGDVHVEREQLQLASGATSAQLAAKCDGNHSGPRCADPACWAQ